MPTDSTACAILAGGRANRLGGVAKGMLRLANGGTIIEHILAEAAAAGLTSMVVVANQPGAYRACGCRMVSDTRPGLGPLGGIETALLYFAGACENVLVLPCDLPAITAHEIAALRHAHLARRARLTVAQTPDLFWQPLCAVVHSALGPAISAALDRGIRSVQQVWQEIGPSAVQFADARPFLNVNTPEDMAAWSQEMRARASGE